MRGGGVGAAILCLRRGGVAGDRLSGVAGGVELEVLSGVAWLLVLRVELGHVDGRVCAVGNDGREVMVTLMKRKREGVEWERTKSSLERNLFW